MLLYKLNVYTSVQLHLGKYFFVHVKSEQNQCKLTFIFQS
jgi:hypothetical protein